jgi:hypothetical protein
MWQLLAQTSDINQLWYVMPLVVSISLVYGATRHELIGPILHNSFRAVVWIIGFMGSIFLILLVISWLL